VFHLEEFRDYLQFERGVSPRTLDAYGRDLQRLVEYAKRQNLDDVAGVTSAHLREFVYELKDQGLQATSIRRTLSAIRTYFTFLVAEKHVTVDPTEKVEMPKTWRKLPGVLSRDDVEKILEAPEIGDRLYWRDRCSSLRMRQGCA
jgi:integrase/recombinase XerD